jgi:hypothetical protein
MKNLVIILFVLIVSKGTAQDSYGLEFGTYFHTYQGINDIDSIRVLVNDSDRGEMFGGIFYEIELIERLTLHSKLFIRPIYVDNTIFNNEAQCKFCPVEKGALSRVTNLSLELLPQVELIKLNGLKIKIFGGMNTSFNFHSEQTEISFNGRHQGVAKVINLLDEVVKPVSFSLIYGVSAEYKRFSIWVKKQHRSNYSREIEITEQKYKFSNTWQFLSFSMGYKFYNQALKKKTR